MLSMMLVADTQSTCNTVLYDFLNIVTFAPFSESVFINKVKTVSFFLKHSVYVSVCVSVIQCETSEYLNE